MTRIPPPAAVSPGAAAFWCCRPRRASRRRSGLRSLLGPPQPSARRATPAASRARSPIGGRLALGLSLALLAWAGQGCGRQQAPQAQQAPRPSQAEQLQSAHQCIRQRQDVETRLASLRRAEWELAQLRGASPPWSRPRPVWDEQLEQRYSPADQELDRQRYERELAAWEASEARARAEWRQRHALRLDAAQERLDRFAAGLRRDHPDLFTGPLSIEVNPPVLARLQRCPTPPG